jgi:hypothetical protein
MTKSVVPELLRELEDYLERQASEWRRLPESSRQPTLPSTSDGKVNARAIITALDRPQHQEQHLFNKPALKSAINAIATEQGLQPIGARAGADVDQATADRIRRTEKRANDVARLVAEQASVIEKQRRTIEALREQIRIFEETGQVIRTGPIRA